MANTYIQNFQSKDFAKATLSHQLAFWKRNITSSDPLSFMVASSYNTEENKSADRLWLEDFFYAADTLVGETEHSQ